MPRQTSACTWWPSSWATTLSISSRLNCSNSVSPSTTRRDEPSPITAALAAVVRALRSIAAIRGCAHAGPREQRVDALRERSPLQRPQAKEQRQQHVRRHVGEQHRPPRQQRGERPPPACAEPGHAGVEEDGHEHAKQQPRAVTLSQSSSHAPSDCVLSPWRRDTR